MSGREIFYGHSAGPKKLGEKTVGKATELQLLCLQVDQTL
jgi:hypothetical protein